MGAQTDIVIRTEAWPAAIADPEDLCHAAIRAGWAVAVDPSLSAEISIALDDDDGLARLNARFRGREGPTNVLSFASGEAPDDPLPPGAPPVMLGDIAIAYQTTAREAAEQGKPLAAHLQHLVVHGLLHLLGYDHETDRDAVRMEAMEVEILERLGIANPYHDGEAMTAPASDERTLRA